MSLAELNSVIRAAQTQFRANDPRRQQALELCSKARELLARNQQEARQLARRACVVLYQ